MNSAEKFLAHAQLVRWLDKGWRFEVKDGALTLRGPVGCVSWQPVGEVSQNVLRELERDGQP